MNFVKPEPIKKPKPNQFLKKNPTQNYKWMMLRFGFAE